MTTLNQFCCPSRYYNGHVYYYLSEQFSYIVVCYVSVSNFKVEKSENLDNAVNINFLRFLTWHFKIVKIAFWDFENVENAFSNVYAGSGHSSVRRSFVLQTPIESRKFLFACLNVVKR